MIDFSPSRCTEVKTSTIRGSKFPFLPSKKAIRDTKQKLASPSVCSLVLCQQKQTSKCDFSPNNVVGLLRNRYSCLSLPHQNYCLRVRRPVKPKQAKQQGRLQAGDSRASFRGQSDIGHKQSEASKQTDRHHQKLREAKLLGLARTIRVSISEVSQGKVGANLNRTKLEVSILCRRNKLHTESAPPHKHHQNLEEADQGSGPARKDARRDPNQRYPCSVRKIEFNLRRVVHRRTSTCTAGLKDAEARLPCSLPLKQAQRASHMEEWQGLVGPWETVQ